MKDSCFRGKVPVKVWGSSYHTAWTLLPNTALCGCVPFWKHWILCSPEGCAQTGTISENTSHCHFCEGHAVFWVICCWFVSKEEAAWSHVEGGWGSCWSSWVFLLALSGMSCNARKVSHFLQNWITPIGFCLLVEIWSKHLLKAPQAGNENLLNYFWNIRNKVEALHWDFNNVCLNWALEKGRCRTAWNCYSSPAHRSVMPLKLWFCLGSKRESSFFLLVKFPVEHYKQRSVSWIQENTKDDGAGYWKLRN